MGPDHEASGVVDPVAQLVQLGPRPPQLLTEPLGVSGNVGEELPEGEGAVAAAAEDGDGVTVGVLDETGVALPLPPAVGDGLQAGFDGVQAAGVGTAGGQVRVDPADFL